MTRIGRERNEGIGSKVEDERVKVLKLVQVSEEDRAIETGGGNEKEEEREGKYRKEKRKSKSRNRQKRRKEERWKLTEEKANNS